MWNCKMYFSNKTEVFEYDNIAAEGCPSEKLTLPFLESLLSFLEMELAPLNTALANTFDLWSGFFNTGNKKYATRAMKILKSLSGRHFYFKMLYLDWYDVYSNICPGHTPSGRNIVRSLNELRLMPEQWSLYQKQILHFFENVLDVDKAGRDTKRQVVAWYNSCGPKAPTPLFHTISLGFEPLESDHFVPALYPRSVPDMIDYSLRSCVERGITVRRCKNCGRYFPQTGRVSAEYCARPTEDGTSVCRETGAFQRWSKRQADDPVFKVYRREYKKRFAWIKAGRISDTDFYAWSKMVREKKKQCDDGSISLAEFEDWLKQS